MIMVWIFALLCGLISVALGYLVLGMGLGGAILGGIVTVLVIRGIFSVIKRSLVLHEVIAPEADGNERTLETNRYIFWRRVLILGILAAIVGGVSAYLGLTLGDILGLAFQVISQVLILMLFMVSNFALFFGPFLLFGRMGRQTIEPGDANWEVKIEDVRGQKSAVNEMVRILRLMEQGRNYVKAGGKRERGILMVGPPGTGKTMLAKAIASTLHMPIIVSSGAAFQGMFIGMDMVAVFMMVRAAKKKARRWGGCAIFIDEFDALGNRRAGMGGGGMGGGMGGMFGGFQLGLNMLLVQMDGVDSPGFLKKNLRRFVNVTLDGLFIPREIGSNGTRIPLRVPMLRAPRWNLFFMGATNRPQVLDEAVTRPGRFGRTINFRIPTREDRKDIAALYFDKKNHDPELDTAARREEFARVTEGYSPAMIEQALSLALMYAFEEGRSAFNWRDLRESMGNVEAGLAEAVEYSERDKVAVARHEMGHAVAARYFLPDHVSARLSIRKRGSTLGYHRTTQQEEQFIKFRSQLAGDVRHGLGAIASERVFYGENSWGVTSDLIQSTSLACSMVGVWGMGPDALDPVMSKKAANIGEMLVSRAETAGGLMDPGRIEAPVLGNPVTRRTVAQILGSAFIDDWRLMYVNKEAIDEAVQALVAQGELVGDEVTGLLDSVGLRLPDESDPYPEETAFVPRLEEEQRPRAIESA
jgi:ATP-dependent Zn protease